MAKEKITVTLDTGVLADVTADAERAGLTRSEMVEIALRNEHLRRQLHAYTTHTVSASDIDAYAARVHTANRAAGL
ncbi:ribbon-helix-helix protein, CopG family [Nocardia sp. NPDC003693]